MNNKELVTRLTVVSLSISILVAVGAWVDSKYASAADVQALSDTIQDDRVERMEFMIERAERRMKYLKSIPEPALTEYQKQELMELEHEKEFLLRKLKRIEGSK